MSHKNAIFVLKLIEITHEIGHSNTVAETFGRVRRTNALVGGSYFPEVKMIIMKIQPKYLHFGIQRILLTTINLNVNRENNMCTIGNKDALFPSWQILRDTVLFQFAEECIDVHDHAISDDIKALFTKKSMFTSQNI
jgi:hypothetical protein